MNNLLNFFSVICLLAVCAACGNGSATRETTQTSGQEMQPGTPAAQTVSYPSLPIDRMQELFNKVDYIDFVFYYADFSMNQSNDASIKATLRHISNEIPTIYPSCQPIGSLFYQSQGVELIQSELYFSDKCVYFIWLENGQRKYANKMTPEGFRFYQQVFAQGQSAN